jgi:hypothetical protein
MTSGTPSGVELPAGRGAMLGELVTAVLRRLTEPLGADESPALDSVGSTVNGMLPSAGVSPSVNNRR